MSCYTVKNEAGKNDPRFLDYVRINNGNENKALDQYVREIYFGETDTDFSVVSAKYADAKSLMDGSFQINDSFTELEANNIRANKNSVYRKVFKKNRFIGQMVDPYGKVVDFELKDLNTEVEKYLNSKKELSKNVIGNISNVIGFRDIGDRQAFAGFLKKIFARLNPNAIYSLVRDLKIEKIRPYQDYESRPFFIRSLAPENIMVHENEVNGVKEYTIIVPTTDRADRGFNQSQKVSFMTGLFGSHHIAQKKGFTIKDSLQGRKHLMASMLAMAIKASDPTAKVNGARFISLHGEGSTFDLDLFEGVRNVRALFDNPETRDLLPEELIGLIKDVSAVKEEDFNPDYVSLLFRNMQEQQADNKTISRPLYNALAGTDNDAKIAAIDERMNFIVNTYNQRDDDKKLPYEKFNTALGKEMVLLSKAKEQLMQYAGLDRRTYNSSSMLTWFDSWRKSLGDMQNAQMNLLFNQYKSVIFGVKQRFEKFTDRKNKAVKAFMDAYEADNGKGVRSRLLNYTQQAYKNLYETEQMRTLENGVLSEEKTEVNLMRFKDPEDMTNNLKGYEREFIRQMVGFHKESIIRYIKKKIVSGEISGYTTAEDWYDKEYAYNELNLPVMRKGSGNFIAEASLKGAASSWGREASDFLEITPASAKAERLKRPFGSATLQMGGIYGGTGREAGLGFDRHNGEIVLVNRQLNQGVNLDVEQILHSSVFQNFKNEHESELTATYTAARIILLKEQIDKNVSRTNELNTLEALFNNLLYNERVDIAQGELDVGAAFDTLRRVSGQVVLAANYKSALLALSGNVVTMMTNSMAARFGKHFFNGSDFRKAVMFSIQHPKMFGDIIDMFLFHERTESSMVFSDRMKEGERGWINQRHLMMLHSLGDRVTKGLILISQLSHENLLDNFTYTDGGALSYDWSKDKRSETVKAHIRERNRKQEKDDLPYDDHQINTLIAISAKMYGAYSDEDKTRIATHGGAQFLAQFKGYLVARSNEAYQTGFENTNISWYDTDDNGNVKATVYYQEGILNTMLYFGNQIIKLKKSPITTFQNMRPEQQANLRKAAADFIFFGALAILHKLVFDDDESNMSKSELEESRRNRNNTNYMYLKFAWLDIVGIYNPTDYLEMFNPAAITFFSKYVVAFDNFIRGDFEKGTDQIWKSTGIGKTTNDIASLFDE